MSSVESPVASGFGIYLSNSVLELARAANVEFVPDPEALGALADRVGINLPDEPRVLLRGQEEHTYQGFPVSGANLLTWCERAIFWRTFLAINLPKQMSNMLL